MTTIYKYPAEDRDDYCFNCTVLMAADELVESVDSITLDPDDSGVVFSEAAPNSAVLNYRGGIVVAIGKGILVRIAGGAIPDGYPYLDIAVQVLFTTDKGNQIVASGILRLIRSPGDCC